MSDLDGHDDLPVQSPHKPADDKEEIYFSGSPVLRASLSNLIGWWIGGLVLLATPIVWQVMAVQGPHWAVWVVCIPLALLLMAVPILQTRTIHFRISNYRIDFERGLLSKTIDTLELWHVDDIKFYASPLDRILNTGTITVMSNDKTTPQLTIRGVPNPRPLFDAMKQRVIAVKRQRGVIKMDVG